MGETYSWRCCKAKSIHFISGCPIQVPEPHSVVLPLPPKATCQSNPSLPSPYPPGHSPEALILSGWHPAPHSTCFHRGCSDGCVSPLILPPLSYILTPVSSSQTGAGAPFFLGEDLELSAPARVGVWWQWWEATGFFSWASFFIQQSLFYINCLISTALRTQRRIQKAGTHLQRPHSLWGTDKQK